jgi:hypothetical protein
MPTPKKPITHEYGEAPTLSISAEKVCFIIIKAREFEVKDEPVEDDPGSNASDDRMISVLEDHEDDPAVEEITSLIDSLSEDEAVDLIALAWLGRDDNTLADWPIIRAEATRAYRSYAENTAAYLLGTPLVSDYLEEALSMFGRSCEEFEINRL